ncbi:MAG: hypothetical protein AAFS10_26650 [Myxococcota bacterium]
MWNRNPWTRLALSLTISAAALASGCSTPPSEKAPVSPSGSTSTEWTMHTTYRGALHLPMSEPGVVDLNGYPKVIRDEAGYRSFIQRIPTRVISKTADPPPSNDPLLAKPTIDWSQHMMVVALRSDILDSSDMTLARVSQTDSILTLRVTVPPAGQRAMMAMPESMGAYMAVVIDRFEGQVIVHMEGGDTP